MPSCSQVMNKPKIKHPTIHGKVQVMSALFLYTTTSQTPAFQKLESRWGYCNKQDYSVSQVTFKIATTSLNIF